MGGPEQVHGTLDAQVLEVRQRALVEHRAHAARQRALAGAYGTRRVVEREALVEPATRPLLEALDERVGMREVVGDDVGGLRGATVGVALRGFLADPVRSRRFDLAMAALLAATLWPMIA